MVKMKLIKKLIKTDPQPGVLFFRCNVCGDDKESGDDTDLHKCFSSSARAVNNKRHSPMRRYGDTRLF